MCSQFGRGERDRCIALHNIDSHLSAEAPLTTLDKTMVQNGSATLQTCGCAVEVCLKILRAKPRLDCK